MSEQQPDLIYQLDERESGLIPLLKRQRTANRAYQVLGIIHFLVISVGLAGKGLQNNGPWLMSIGAGLAMGLLFLLTFLHLADYHGNGSGDGRLVEGGRSE